MIRRLRRWWRRHWGVLVAGIVWAAIIVILIAILGPGAFNQP